MPDREPIVEEDRMPKPEPVAMDECRTSDTAPCKPCVCEGGMTKTTRPGKAAVHSTKAAVHSTKAAVHRTKTGMSAEAVSAAKSPVPATAAVSAAC